MMVIASREDHSMIKEIVPGIACFRYGFQYEKESLGEMISQIDSFPEIRLVR
jgi:hypothetical protein